MVEEITGSALPVVLLVEHDDGWREVLADLLQYTGYGVLEARNGGDALELLASCDDPRPSLVLLDLEMPGMSGWEFLACLRSDVASARLPVLVLSGDSAHPEALSHGAISGYVVRPYVAQDLVERIERLLSRGQDAEYVSLRNRP